MVSPWYHQAFIKYHQAVKPSLSVHQATHQVLIKPSSNFHQGLIKPSSRTRQAFIKRASSLQQTTHQVLIKRFIKRLIKFSLSFHQTFIKDSSSLHQAFISSVHQATHQGFIMVSSSLLKYHQALKPSLSVHQGLIKFASSF